LNLGVLLRDEGDLEGGITELRRASALAPENPLLRHNLADALAAHGQREEAIIEYRRALDLKPDFPEALCNLGGLLQTSGRYAEALDVFERGHKLGSKRPAWPYPSGEWVRRARRLVELDERFPALLRGEWRPRQGSEAVEVAIMACDKKLYALSVRLYREAFAADPALATCSNPPHRYNAACAAALAACGTGQDGRPTDADERVALRASARDWLQADLAALTETLEGGSPQARQEARKTLRNWNRDPDLVGVREPESLAKLPEPERDSWQALWSEVSRRSDPPRSPK
jgi:tetratricopeptide (TPR) repeat protein